MNPILKQTAAAAAAALALWATPAALSTAHAQEVVTLKVSHFMAPNANIQKSVIEPWCERIGQESQGRLKCQIYPALQLGGTTAQLVDQVKNGVADIVWTSPGYTPGRFPRIEALDLPFVLPAGGLDGSRAMWAYYEKDAQADFADFKVLALFSSSNAVISTASKPVSTLADFRGLKLRTPSRSASRLLSALGGTPVNMPPPQITEAVSKGVVDGAMAPWEMLPGIKLDEVTRYHIEGPANQPGFTQASLALLMNKGRYSRLPKDLQAVIDKNSGLTLSEAAGRSWDAASQVARAKVLAEKHTVMTIKPEDYRAMQTAAQSVQDEWVKETTDRGIAAAPLVQSLRAIGAKNLPR